MQRRPRRLPLLTVSANREVAERRVDEGLALLDDLGTLGVLRSNKSRGQPLGQPFDYTETFYNSKLLLSALGYLSPVATRGKPNTRVTSRKVAVCSRN